MDNQHLANILARRIFDEGKEPFSVVHRIEFKGFFDGKECGMGGYAEQPLARVLKRLLDEYLPPQNGDSES